MNKGHSICAADDFKSAEIEKFNAVTYDEGFGISGRLLAHCSMNKGHSICQFFNGDELDVLRQSLKESNYYLMPGTDSRPFDLTLFVFEMLFGVDVVGRVLEQVERERALELRQNVLGPGLEQKEDPDYQSMDVESSPEKSPEKSQSVQEMSMSFEDLGHSSQDAEIILMEEAEGDVP